MSRIINIPGSDSSDYYSDVAAGKIEGVEAVTKFGVNESVGTSFVDVCSQAANLVYLTTAATIEAVSSDTNDTIAGTGARKIMIVGLDENFDEVQEEVELAGTTATTATTITFLRVFRTYVTEVGAYGNTNIGAITIRVSGGGSTQAHILAGYSQTQTTHFTVPRGHNGCLVGVAINVATTKAATVKLLVRQNAGGTGSPFEPWATFFVFHGLVGSNPLPFVVPAPLSAKSDIRIQAKSSAGTIEVSAQYQMVLEKAGIGI